MLFEYQMQAMTFVHCGSVGSIGMVNWSSSLQESGPGNCPTGFVCASRSTIEKYGMSCMLIPWSSKGDVWVVRLLSDASIAEGGTFWIHSLNRLSIRLPL